MGEASQRCEVVGAGLTRWTERVIGLDVIQIHGPIGLPGPVRKQLHRVREFDAFADPVGDLVGVDTGRVVQVDDRLDGVGPVADQLGQL